MNRRQYAPFGFWPSPITPASASDHLRLEDVQWDESGALLWLEGHSDQNSITARLPSGKLLDVTCGLSAHARVGYGGGDFTVKNGQVLFVGSDGTLYITRLDGQKPRPLTTPGKAAASPALSPDGRQVLLVLSDGVEDGLALVSMDPPGRFQILDRRADFFMQPDWRPSGASAAWIEWDHPNMPWDGTRLVMADLVGDPARLENVRIIAGGQATPVCQPQFSPDGRWLAYITADGDWEKLILFQPESGALRTLAARDGLLISTPPWVQGMRFFSWTRDSRAIWYLAGSDDPSTMGLYHVEVGSGVSNQANSFPYTWLNQISVSPGTSQPAMIASSPELPRRVVAWNGNRLDEVFRSNPEDIPTAFLPQPRLISWKAPDGTDVFGLYSPPSNPDYFCRGLPPAIISIHGGPTVPVPRAFHVETACFTSRGYAWLDVCYRGSWGLGRSFMQKLDHLWGVVDVEDAAGAALALVDQKLADPERLILRGSSAGGFTVLNALAQFPGRFKAGVCLYGVSNLFTLAEKTHKFEAHYHERLVGVLPKDVLLYTKRSPEFQAARIRDPLLLFHGREDRVVPIEQTERIIAALQKSGTPCIFKAYEDEGHGFRKTETQEDVLTLTQQFLQKYVLRQP